MRLLARLRHDNAKHTQWPQSQHKDHHQNTYSSSDYGRHHIDHRLVSTMKELEVPHHYCFQISLIPALKALDKGRFAGIAQQHQTELH